jgi:hypothetical protein
MNTVPNLDHATGIRFGYMSGRDIFDLIDDVQTQGDSIEYENLKEQVRKDLANALSEYLNDKDVADLSEEFVGEVMNANSFSVEFDEERHRLIKGPAEDPTMLLQTSYMGGGLCLWVMKSQFVTWCQLCSPCVPGAGDLDLPSTPEDGYATYCPDPKDLPEEIRSKMTIVTLEHYQNEMSGR